MRKRRAAACALVAVLIVLAVGAALPIWMDWYFIDWEGVGYWVPLWEVGSPTPPAGRAPSGRGEFWRPQEYNLIQGAILLLLAAGVGYGVYRVLARRRSSEEVRTLVERPAGTLPDGRNEPAVVPAHESPAVDGGR